VFELYFP